MIKNIKVELDGFTYNIVQMSGEQAFKMQLKIANSLSNFEMSAFSEKSESDIILLFIKGLFGALKPEIVLPIVKELLANVGFVEVNEAIAESVGFDVKRHCTTKVDVNNFVGKDLVHLYKLVFEVLKANYEDFLIQAKGFIGSLLSGTQVSNGLVKM